MIRIEDLTDDWYTKCTIKYLYGYVELNKDNNLVFVSRNSNAIRMVKANQITLLDGSKLKMKILRKDVKKIAKLEVNQPNKYIIVPQDNMLTCNDTPLSAKTIVLMTDPPTIYVSQKKFAQEIKTTERPDIETAKAKYLTGERASNNFDNMQMDEAPVLMQTSTNNTAPSTQKRTTSSSNSGLYLVTKTLFKENQTGGVDFWGYELQDVTNGKTKQLDKPATLDMAKRKLIKNAKYEGNNLVGVGINLDDLEQDYVG